MSDPKTPKSAHPFDADDGRDLFDDLFSVASATECTGLIQTPPVSDEEAEAYTEIYAIPQPENRNPDGLQQKEGNSRTR